MAQELFAEAALVDHDALRHAQAKNNVVDAELVLKKAFFTDVAPALAAWRATRKMTTDPLSYEAKRDLLASISAASSVGSKAALAYGHDALGRRTSIVDKSGPALPTESGLNLVGNANARLRRGKILGVSRHQQTALAPRRRPYDGVGQSNPELFSDLNGFARDLDRKVMDGETIQESLACFLFLR
jgi:hypothetical protein